MSDKRNQGEDEGEIPEEYDIESLRIAREEANRVIDHQIRTLTDIDNKASDTLRYSILFLGLLLTASSLVLGTELGPTEVVQGMPDVLLYLSVGCLSVGVLAILLTVIMSILTYKSTEFKPGPSYGDIDRYVEKKYTEKEWLILLVRSSSSWIETNRMSNNQDATMLSRAHISLAVGISLIFVGIAFYGAGVYIANMSRSEEKPRNVEEEELLEGQLVFKGPQADRDEKNGETE